MLIWCNSCISLAQIIMCFVQTRATLDLSQNPFEIRTNILNGWDHSYSRTLWKPDLCNPMFKKSSFQMFPDFWMVGFQIPTVRTLDSSGIQMTTVWYFDCYPLTVSQVGVTVLVLLFYYSDVFLIQILRHSDLYEKHSLLSSGVGPTKKVGKLVSSIDQSSINEIPPAMVFL